MLDIREIRKHPNQVKKQLAARGDLEVDLDHILRLDEEHRQMIRAVEDIRHEQKKLSEKIGRLKKEQKGAGTLVGEVAALREKMAKLEPKRGRLSAEIEELLLDIPNLPHESVPEGKDESENVEVRRWGKAREFDFKVRSHDDIGTSLGILDFERGAKIAGARFTVLHGLGARLERGLINFMIDLHTNEHGYTETWPTAIVNRESMTVTGQLPKFSEDQFALAAFDGHLVPTAEVPVTNYHRDEILAAESIPLRYVAYTPCFRKEAGSYGKDVKGMIRQHQFDKVELVIFSEPERSYGELEKLTADAEVVLQRLGLHYRVVSLCSGDLGFAAAKTYDLEVWIPSQKRYREISSCSNFEDYQARRGSIRYRDPKAKRPLLLHTLNGSGLAVGRTLVAILENFQNADGSVTIPEALRPYAGGETEIRPPGRRGG